MITLYLPDMLLKKMMCSHCTQYLSYFPVYTKKNSSGAICGRCKLPDQDIFIRDTSYEVIAQFFLFPCSYNEHGCKDYLTPPKLKEHEPYCKYRKYPCPSNNYSKSHWQGPSADLINFEEEHADLLLKEPTFELNFINSIEENLLFTIDHEMFVLRKEVDSRKQIFMCTVGHLKTSNNAESYNYFVKVESGDKNYFIKCMDMKADGQDTTKLVAENLKERLHDPASIIVTVSIFSSNKAVNTEERSTSEGKNMRKDPNINWDILSELECPVCYDYLLPPIYQCLNGHSICQYCKVQVQECPICKTAIQMTQNFVLEKMIQYLTYPCKFYKTGCSFYAKSTGIGTHEAICEFGPYECPLKDVHYCNWKSNSSELVDHIDNYHNDSILLTDKIDAPFDKDTTNEQVYLIKFAGRVFKFVFKYANNKFWWTVQLVGPSDECKYTFDIDLHDYAGNKRRCYQTGPVVPLTKQEDSFRNPDNFLTLTLETVKPFVKNNFGYRLKIYKD